MKHDILTKQKLKLMLIILNHYADVHILLLQQTAALKDSWQIQGEKNSVLTLQSNLKVLIVVVKMQRLIFIQLMLTSRA